MKHLTLLLIAAAALTAPTVAHGQGKDVEARLRKISIREEATINKAAKRTYFPETVRDRWMKEMAEHFPTATVVDAGGEVDADRWYAAVTGGREAWARADVADKSFRELFDRAAKDLGVPGGEVLTRQQFRDYAAGALRAGTSPLWKNKDAEADPLEDVDRLFKDCDADRNGALGPDEQSDALRQAARQVDRNGDGLVNAEEYRGYFEGQLLVRRDHPELLQKPLKNDPPPMASVAEPPASPRPAAPIPDVKVPGWFPALDEDADGQVGLYEWRKAGRPTADFLLLDLNADCYLTPKELARYLADNPESPFAGKKLPNPRK